MGDKYFLAYYPKLVAILLEHQGKDGSWLSDDGNDRSGGRELLHGDGRPGAGGRISLFADLSEIIGVTETLPHPLPPIDPRKEVAMKVLSPASSRSRRTARLLRVLIAAAAVAAS